jgi:hypothetical protein
MSDTVAVAIGVIAYVVWEAVVGFPFYRALLAYRRAADRAGEPSDQWIRKPAANPSLEGERQQLVRRFWLYVIASTIGVLALVAWLLYVLNR